MPLRESCVDTEGFVPAIGDRGEPLIEKIPGMADQAGQRVAEVLVLASAETVLLHHHAASKAPVLRRRVKRGQLLAFAGRESLRDNGVAVCIQIGFDEPPVDRGDPLVQVGKTSVHGCAIEDLHAFASRSSSARLRSTPQR